MKYVKRLTAFLTIFLFLWLSFFTIIGFLFVDAPCLTKPDKISPIDNFLYPERETKAECYSYWDWEKKIRVIGTLSFLPALFGMVILLSNKKGWPE